MKEAFINNILIKTKDVIQPYQLNILKDTLITELSSYDLILKSTEIATINKTPDTLLHTFIPVKQLAEKSTKTLERYYSVNYDLIHAISMPLDVMKRCYSSFFSWLVAENFIQKNSCLAISQIKYPKTIKKPFSLTEMKRIESACSNPHDLALVSFLYASGCLYTGSRTRQSRKIRV